MNSDKSVNFNNFFKRIQPCYCFDQEILFQYIDLIFGEIRMKKNKNELSLKIDLENFSQFLQLPLIISRKIYESFFKVIPYKMGENEFLSKEEFTQGIMNLYFSNFDELIVSTFKILKSSCNELPVILLEEVILLLSYFNTSSPDLHIPPKNLEELIKIFFDKKIYLNVNEYEEIIKNKNSNIFILILIFLFYKQPFSKESLKFFEEKCFNSNYDEKLLVSDKKLDYDINYIYPPSEELYVFLKYFRNPFYENKRKFGSKNIKEFEINTIIENSKENSWKFSCEQSEIKIEDSSTSENSPISHSSKKSSNYTFQSQNIEMTSSYQVTSDNKLRKFKLKLGEKEIFIFKFSEGKKEYIFEKFIPLSGYYVTLSNNVKIQERNFYSFALLNSYGNTTTNIKNIFFMQSKEECEDFVLKTKEKMNIIDFEDNYKLYEIIGEGQFGSVYLGKDIKTEKEVAVKVIKKSKMSENEVKIVRSEIDIMKFLKFNPHKNVVNSIDIFEDKNHIYIVMECLYGGSLDSYIENKGRLLKKNEIKCVALQIGKALEFLHKKGIIHRDIKTDNIMLKGNNLEDVKLLDFGLAKVLCKNEKTKEGFGTLIYSAPEILYKTPYNNKVDVWSFGILIFYLVHGTYPFDGHGLPMTEIAYKICEDSLIFPEDKSCCLNIKLLIKQCLHKSISKRISIRKLLKQNLMG